MTTINAASPVVLSGSQSSAARRSQVARISHHPSTAPAQWHALSGFRSVAALNVVSATPARSSVAKAAHAAPLNRLATNGGEKCGLEAVVQEFEGLLWNEVAQAMSAVKLGPSGLGSAGDTYRRMLWSKVTSRDFAGTDRALTRTMLAQLSPNAARALPPAVSKTAATHAAISAGTRTPRSWVHDIWSAIKAGAEALRVPAQGLLAQAALETGWGRHARGNNVFGVKAHGDSSTFAALTHEFTDGIVHEVHATFQSYRSIAHAVDDFVHVVQNLHPQALGQKTVSAFAQALQASGYATDPHYARKIEAVAASPRMRSLLAEVK